MVCGFLLKHHIHLTLVFVFGWCCTLVRSRKQLCNILRDEKTLTITDFADEILFKDSNSVRYGSSRIKQAIYQTFHFVNYQLITLYTNEYINIMAIFLKVCRVTFFWIIFSKILTNFMRSKKKKESINSKAENFFFLTFHVWFVRLQKKNMWSYHPIWLKITSKFETKNEKFSFQDIVRNRFFLFWNFKIKSVSLVDICYLKIEFLFTFGIFSQKIVHIMKIFQ